MNGADACPFCYRRRSSAWTRTPLPRTTVRRLMAFIDITRTVAELEPKSASAERLLLFALPYRARRASAGAGQPSREVRRERVPLGRHVDRVGQVSLDQPVEPLRPLDF